jgi:hypothetical protein
VGDLDRFWRDIETAYDRHIVADGKQAVLMILAAFLITFASVRFITHSIRAGRFHRLLRNVATPGGTHLHHLVPGILTLLTTGFLAIGRVPEIDRSLLAAIFGFGAALTLDEFALWLHLDDVYWAKQGRTSIDAVVIAATLLALAVLGWGFWLDLGRAFARLVGLL